MPFQRPWLLIGVSARIYYPAGPVLDLGGVWTKTLHYLEQSVAHWVMRGGALPVMVPAVDADSIVKRSEIELAHYAEALDGLVLQGGNDLAPESYGETPLKPDWAGDRVRDRYEMELVAGLHGRRQAGVRHLPRLPAAERDARRHAAAGHRHAAARLAARTATRRATSATSTTIELVAGLAAGAAVPGRCAARTVNSIHHQGIKDLAPGFDVEARCPDDGMIEAIRRRGPGYVAAVQWHPEFHDTEHGTFDDARAAGRLSRRGARHAPSD